MYPMRGPITPEFFVMSLPSTVIVPPCSFFWPTTHDSSVVLPQPEAPSKPYLN